MSEVYIKLHHRMALFHLDINMFSVINSQFKFPIDIKCVSWGHLFFDFIKTIT